MKQKSLFEQDNKNGLSYKTLDIIYFWNKQNNQYLPNHRTKKNSKVLEKIESNINNVGMSSIKIKNSIKKYSEMFNEDFCKFSKNQKLYSFGLDDFLIFSSYTKERINKNKAIKQTFLGVNSLCRQISKDDSEFYFKTKIQKHAPENKTVESVIDIIEGYNKKFPGSINLDFDEEYNEIIINSSSRMELFLKENTGKIALQSGIIHDSKDVWEKQKRYCNPKALKNWMLDFIIEKYQNKFKFVWLNSGFIYEDFLEYLDKKGRKK